VLADRLRLVEAAQRRQVDVAPSAWPPIRPPTSPTSSATLPTTTRPDSPRGASRPVR
jgi:hypothetical protein